MNPRPPTRAPVGSTRSGLRVNRKFLAFCRTSHIYLTMFGLIVMFFFGITGFTINHEDWFGATEPRVVELAGQTPAPLLAANDNLRVVESLRTQFHIRGAMTSFDDFGDHLSVGFKDPGQMWQVEVNKPDGKTTVHQEIYNLTALINNLHRGRYSGPAWRWVIDISALFIALACFTGVVLWLALPARRNLGILALVAGTLGTAVIYYCLVPGPDIKPPAPPPAATTPAATVSPAQP